MSNEAIFTVIFGLVFGPVCVYAAIELARQYRDFN
jgi:hypothetical protein